jgi:hypothetical protein
MRNRQNWMWYIKHARNPYIQDAEAEGSQVQGQPGLNCKNLLQKVK